MLCIWTVQSCCVNVECVIVRALGSTCDRDFESESGGHWNDQTSWTMVAAVVRHAEFAHCGCWWFVRVDSIWKLQFQLSRMFPQMLLHHAIDNFTLALGLFAPDLLCQLIICYRLTPVYTEGNFKALMRKKRRYNCTLSTGVYCGLNQD